MKWQRRAEKLRKKKARWVEHGRKFGEMVRNAVRRRNEFWKN